MLDFDNLDFPWDFYGRKWWPRERNLKTVIHMERLISENDVVLVFNDFVDALES